MARKYEKARLEGLDDLEKAIKRLSERTQGEHLRAATSAGAEIVRDVASQLAPRSADGSHGRPAGFLSKNVAAEVQFTRTQDKAMVHVGITPNAWYGRLQETGTQFQPAQPFLRPALDETKDSVVAEVTEQLNRLILNAVR